MEEIFSYFKNANVFEFISAKDLKKYKEKIKLMEEIDKQKLTMIIKEAKSLNINYINFTYFFFETEDEKLYFVKELKNGNLRIKNLKIERIITPTDINVVMRDIKAYGAFKHRNKTLKYDDIKQYIDNPLLLVDADLKWVIDKIRLEESKKKIENLKSKKDLKVEVNHSKEKIKKKKEKKEFNEDKKIDNKKNKDNIFMYCLVGFTIGVILASITIIIGNYM